MKLGLLSSLLGGAVVPFVSVILGYIVKMFDPDLTKEETYQMLLDFLWFMILICVLTFVTAYLGYTLMQTSAERVSFRLRAKYLSGLLKQEIEFFERQ